MSPRRASCACGQLHLECTGEPIRVSMCHCLACQQRTGSVYGVQARFKREAVTAIEGRSTEFVRRGDESGDPCTLHFCPVCGSTVYWELAKQPDVIAVAVGAFADPTFPAPRISIYEVRSHPWALPTGIELEHWD
ncbi:GFA family protein [Corallococcus llansteffanensis]|uniref:GFA family protein n=1 Tax=Corallococcus llansteffanensis TaxID=2316731 RepID=A0A3A8PJN5_9BACT|nr:GFA family protein [Corallococcus llansteffanensis]RKH54861.1 GFA family protein [Corallococcus llansteffanensis]